MEEWQRFDLNNHTLFGTFEENGLALLYLLGSVYDANGDRAGGMVHLQQFPGLYCIGTGSYNAQFWLNFRRQTLGLSPKQSAYHGYEAKIMASKAPTVNNNIELLVASNDRSFYLTEEKPSVGGCPVSLTELRTMFDAYGPRSTHAIGHQQPKPLTSRKSAGQK
jgi:hypothetical protein